MFKPISVGDLGFSINHIKTFDIIMNAKFVFSNFVLGGEGGCSLAAPCFSLPVGHVPKF
jgi:hypothetical protein